MANEPSHPVPQHPHAIAPGNSTRGSPRGPPGGRRAQPPGENAAPHGEHQKGGARGGRQAQPRPRRWAHKTRPEVSRQAQPPRALTWRGRPTIPAAQRQARGAGEADKPSNPRASWHPPGGHGSDRQAQPPRPQPSQCTCHGQPMHEDSCAGSQEADMPSHLAREQPTTGTQEGRARGGRQPQPHPHHWT